VKRKFLPKVDLIFLIIPPLAVALIGLTIYYHFQKLQMSVFEANKALEMQFADLKTSMVAFRAFQAKLEETGGKGVEVAPVASQSAQISRLIGQKEFAKAEELSASFSASLDEMYVRKLEEDKKKTEEQKIKLEAKMNDYKSQKVDVSGVEKQIPKISDLIDQKKFPEAQELIASLDKKLDELMAAKKEADRKVAEEAARKASEAQKAQTASVMAGSGYQYFTIGTDRGNFNIHLVKMNLSGLRIVTDTADASECYNNCTAKPLINYVSENGGFAGINGTYFCPPDYSWCSSKVNTFDTPVYNTRLGKLLHADKLFWNDRSMFVFGPSNEVSFFAQARDYNGTAMKAAIANFPGLVNNRQNIVNNYPIDDKSRNAKINRNGIGVGGGYVYLVSTQGATVPDLASIFMALGVDYALNLDGGGSSALYYGGYKVGPGRSLPNAIIFGQ